MVGSAARAVLCHCHSGSGHVLCKEGLGKDVFVSNNLVTNKTFSNINTGSA